MPRYDYYCACGHTAEEFQHMSEPALIVCPACKHPTYKKGVVPFHVPQREYQQPIELMSIAVNDIDEVREFQKRNPGVDISDDINDPKFGIPIARSRHQKLSILKNEGYVETN